MDELSGVQVFWIIIICAGLIALTITSVVEHIVGRKKILVVAPESDAPPEVWVAYYEASSRGR